MNLILEHRLRNETAEMRHLGLWVADFARSAQLPTSVQEAIDLALEECVTNIISHACNDGLEHWVTIRFKAGAEEVRVEVEDDGPEFNPLTVPPVDVQEPLENRAVGGLGVHMIRQLMDAVEYRRVDDRNILTLIKRTT
jgi:anti-sigma regulatory factor (Ser/Thr protein kinase)